MNKYNFVLSLTNNDNDYQLEQAAAAEDAARRFGVHLQILSADNDAITQSQQLLKVIQSSSEHTDGIIFEPAGGTAMPQVARAAATAGIAWVVLNREVQYIEELRKVHHIPAFALTSDHEEIGRIQGRQLAALLPKGGSVLYIQGPAESLAAKQRATGMSETRPAQIDVKPMKAQWTEASAYRMVSSWLRLSTSHQMNIDAVAAQDDSMAIGARKAFQELPEGPARDRWLKLPYLGCDGLPDSGQAWVRQGLLTATVYIPPNAGTAVEMLVDAMQTGIMPPQQTLTKAVPYPEMKLLTSRQKEKTLSARSAANS